MTTINAIPEAKVTTNGTQDACPRADCSSGAAPNMRKAPSTAPGNDPRPPMMTIATTRSESSGPKSRAAIVPARSPKTTPPRAAIPPESAKANRR